MTWGLLKTLPGYRLLGSTLWPKLPQVQVGHGLALAGSPAAAVGAEKGSCRPCRTPQGHRGGKDAPVKRSEGRPRCRREGLRHPRAEMPGGRTEPASPALLGGREGVCLGVRIWPRSSPPPARVPFPGRIRLSRGHGATAEPASSLPQHPRLQLATGRGPGASLGTPRAPGAPQAAGPALQLHPDTPGSPGWPHPHLRVNIRGVGGRLCLLSTPVSPIRSLFSESARAEVFLDDLDCSPRESITPSAGNRARSK